MIDNRLEEIKNIEPAKLFDEDIFKSIGLYVDDVISNLQVGEAKELLIHLSRSLGQIPVSDQTISWRKRYNDLIDRLAWTAFPFVSDGIAEKLFSGQIVQAIKGEINLLDKVKGYFQMSLGDPNAINARRRLILSSLKNNNENIGQKKISVVGMASDLPSTIKNWLSDFDQSSTLEKRTNKLAIMEYMNMSRNLAGVSEADREALREIFELYDDLRFLIANDDLVETEHRLPEFLPDLNAKYDNNQRNKEAVADDGTELLRQAYQGDPKKQKAFAEQLDKLKKTSGDNADLIKDEFYKAVQTQDAVRTVASVKLLAQNNQLLDFIKNDQKLNKFLTATWAKQYGQPLAEEFAKDPAQPKFLRLFLKYVMVERLKMSESDAGRIGLQIGNVFASQGKADFNRLAYFDVASKSFKWFAD